MVKILLCWIIVMPGLIAAQSTIKGRVIGLNGEPLIAANILLLHAGDSSLAKASIADDNGDYTLAGIPGGSYLLQYSAAGYLTYYSPIRRLTAADSSVDMGTKQMTPYSRELSAVVIKAQKQLYQQKPEGMIVNVEGSLLSKGSSALEVLERSPGVTVNHRDNSIELNGKSGVVVMLDGKAMRMSMEQVVTLLRGMNADDIATIALLTTPPASYDAEGSAGLINIVLKKNKKQGTNAAVSVTGGYGVREKGVAGINLSHNVRNMHAYGSYSYSHNNTYSDLYITSAQTMPFLGGATEVLFLDTTTRLQRSHDAFAGIDIDVDTKTKIGMGINLNSSGSQQTTINNAGYNVLPDSLLQFNGINHSVAYWRNMMYTLFLEKQASNSSKIGMGLDYLHFKNSSNAEVSSSFIDKHGAQAGTDENLFAPRQRGAANTIIQVGVVKADYTASLSQKVKLEAGMKAAFTVSKSISGIESFVNETWTGDVQTSNNIVMKEGIGAAYTSFNVQLNPTTNFVMGARYEYAYTGMDNPKADSSILRRKLGSLFPSFFFSKKWNADTELQFSYTKRITRPSYNDLASYVGYSDPTAVYTGNPFLQPTITHNIKIGYTHSGYALSLLFSRDKNTIARYQLTESPSGDILFISPQNIQWSQSIGFQANLPLKITDYWTMNYNLLGGPRQYKVSFTKNAFIKTYFGYSINAIQSFTLPWKLSAELTGRYEGSSFNGTQKISGFAVVNVAVKKELNNGYGSLQLAVTDVFSSERYRIKYGTLTEEPFSIRSHVIFSPESARFPIIKLSYSRSFGSGDLKRKQRNQPDDETDRIRKE